MANNNNNDDINKLNVLMIGSGEYTSGVTGSTTSKSDKKIGVIALVMFDLKRRGKVDDLFMAGTRSSKFETIRKHFKENIEEVYKDFDVEFESFPKPEVERDPKAYLQALDKLKPGDAVTIFTPDNTHFEIAKECILRGVNVLVTKPAVMKLEHHKILIKLAKENNVLVATEVHKRWDPIYQDAWYRISSGEVGMFNYFNSYMSQPKFQLDTFRGWADTSDISYYLNSHHIDFHAWAMKGKGKPIKVTGIASKGIATNEYDIDTEDTITLSVTWENIKDDKNDHNKSYGIAIYTSSWTAPISDVHSQQRFHFLGSTGEVVIDQAHRGYSLSKDSNGYKSVNPLFMKYTPDAKGNFQGQSGYGYKSIECFIDAVIEFENNKKTNPENQNLLNSYDDMLATISTTSQVTAILEAGRISLDNNNQSVSILYEDEDSPLTPTSISII